MKQVSCERYDRDTERHEMSTQKWSFGIYLTRFVIAKETSLPTRLYLPTINGIPSARFREMESMMKPQIFPVRVVRLKPGTYVEIS